MDKRSIEVSFPVKEVSELSAKEKSIRQGNISTLHIWWARRPLASSRSTNYSSLTPVPHDEIDKIKNRNFIIDLSKWENSLNHNLIDKAKKDILNANGGVQPKVLDPFSGGGSIPLEALRLGCETYSNDYNPVAVLIEKCTLEYPQKYGKSNHDWIDKKTSLLNDVKKWSQWVIKETKKDIGIFFPNDDDGSIPVGYIWARTLKCQNPSCEAEIPLMRQFWLSKKKNKKIAIMPKINGNKIDIEIVGQDGDIPKDFDPSKGTVDGAICDCLLCPTRVEAKKTREIFQEGESGERLVAVVLIHPKKGGKSYRKATSEDIQTYLKSERYLEQKRNVLIEKLGIDPVPDEPLPPIGTLGFRVQRYGILKWGDLFNNRQKLVLITLMEKIQEAYKNMISSGLEKEYSKAIISYLALALDKIAEKNSNVSRWANTKETVAGTFSRQALPMVWDYFESNVFSGSTGDWSNSVEYELKVIKNCMEFANPAFVNQGSATNLPYNDNYFDAIFTDPPYYDNVPYSYLSDFFYVWLKRTLGFVYPELFFSPLTPKKEEIVAYTHETSWDDAKNYFEMMLNNSFKEMSRVLKPDGICTIVYAHKTTAGWETVINAILDSGLTVTASWPLSTEMQSRLRAKSSAALASSIYIVARKFEKKELGWFKDVKGEIESYVPQKLDKLWEEGISGADFFIAAIGSAIEIFGKYEKVLDNEGNEIRADKLLSFVRDVVADYTVRQILHNGISDELSPLTKFYLMWRWNYGEVRVPFDDARKLAQSAGIDLINEWNKGFIIKRGEFITVQGPEKRDKELLEASNELIDVMHYVCLLWKEGKSDEMKFFLKKSGFGEGEALYKVAQAISETLPNSSSEKKMIEGFLSDRDSIMKDMRDDESQTKLV